VLVTHCIVLFLFVWQAEVVQVLNVVLN
jgi:hypothetical protein